MENQDARAMIYRARFGVVEILLKGGHQEQALQRMEELVARDPDYADANNDLAVLYYEAGRFADAHRSIRRAAELGPGDPAIRRNLEAMTAAVAQPPAGQPLAAAATPAPVAAVASPAHSYDACTVVVEALMNAGQPTKAICEIEAFVDRHPTHAEAWNDIAVLHHAQGNMEPALIASRIALEIEGDNPHYRHTRAALLLEDGRLQEALHTIDPVLTANPRDVDALILAGDLSLAIGSVADARPFYKRAMVVDPSCARAAVKLATTAPPPPRYDATF
ncbi:MAG TPA: tetratricopeptide repeat protein [Polyangia bacterium]|jgi:Flp pilus assembly protein TadD|nr:tetratricopeptide repeat protein [Polyangia bacterium]